MQRRKLGNSNNFNSVAARFEHIPVWRTYGKYRKQMKRGYSKIDTIPSEKQGRNYNVSYKKTIWGMPYIKADKNTE